MAVENKTIEERIADIHELEKLVRSRQQTINEIQLDIAETQKKRAEKVAKLKDHMTQITAEIDRQPTANKGWQIDNCQIANATYARSDRQTD